MGDLRRVPPPTLYLTSSAPLQLPTRHPPVYLLINLLVVLTYFFLVMVFHAHTIRVVINYVSSLNNKNCVYCMKKLKVKKLKSMSDGVRFSREVFSFGV